MLEHTSLDRRQLLGALALTLTAAPFAASGSAFAQSGSAKPAGPGPIRPGANTSFAICMTQFMVRASSPS